jgi:protein phosphatase
MKGLRAEKIVQKIETTGSIPQARFGHTVTAISKTKVILFGGAIGDTGKYSITGETFCFDIVSHYWSKIDRVSGVAPSARAAHASCAVEGLQLVIYGGATGGGSLASDDLHLLDLRKGEDEGSWMIVPVVGSTPGRRYGHSLVFIKPHLLAFGGNTGNESVNDVWSLNVEKSPFSWVKLEIQGDVPKPRVYHSACLCNTGSAMGMMVIFGGRTNDQSALNDTWGLRRHRDGRWDWVRAPYKNSGEQAYSRYQHTTLFIGSKMLVLGGRTNQVGEVVPVEAYDTESSEWLKFPSIQRFRHTSWALDSEIFIHGGFENETPNIPTDTIVKLDSTKLLGKIESGPRSVIEPRMNLDQSRPIPRIPRNVNKTPEIRLAQQVLVSMGGEQTDDYGEVVKKVPIERLQEEGKRIGFKPLPPSMTKSASAPESSATAILDVLFRSHEWNNLPDVKFTRAATDASRMNIRKESILLLIKECEDILKQEPNIIRMRAPVKIFGSLNGQYIDLLRSFESYGEPSEKLGDGDIESFDYLFLGDFVDRGSKSLETMCLLMALKVKNPDQVILLRGHHEDPQLNVHYGLAQECRSKLEEDPSDPGSVFASLNTMFEYLPLCAIIEDKILCVHGGISQSLKSIEDLESISKPICINHVPQTPEQQALLDLIWADPCENDREVGFKLHSSRSQFGNIYKFGADKLQKFLSDNKLGMIVRSHECVMEGYERSPQNDLITVFSATDYCGKYKNAAAILIVKRNLEIVPKLIYPLNGASSSWIDNEDSLRLRPATPPKWKSR